MGKKRILVVDDEAGFNRLLKLNLEQTGAYEVRTENKGARALEAARAFKPDLVLLDVMMPDLDGGEVAAQLKADPHLRHIPIVFLTAVVSKDETGAHEGVIGEQVFLAKPVSVGGMIACIEKQLRV